MKKLLMITGTLLLLCIIITSQTNNTAISADPLITEDISQEASFDTSHKEMSENSSEDFYVLKEYNNYVAVFHNNDERPLYVSNTLVKVLPQADRELLKHGIYADNKKALARLIEDYCSWFFIYSIIALK